MPSLKSILSLLALSSVVVDNPMPQRVLAKAMRVVALVVLSMILLGALIAALLFSAGILLVDRGFTEVEAIMIVAGSLLAVTVAIVICTIVSLQKLMIEAKVGARRSVPVTAHLANKATDILEAFVEGLLRPPLNK